MLHPSPTLAPSLNRVEWSNNRVSIVLILLILIVVAIALPLLGVSIDPVMGRIIVAVLLVGLIVWLLMGGVGAIVRV